MIDSSTKDRAAGVSGCTSHCVGQCTPACTGQGHCIPNITALTRQRPGRADMLAWSTARELAGRVAPLDSY